MLSSHLTYIAVQQRISELHRAADRDRAVRSIREPRKPGTKTGRVSLRRLLPRDSR